MGPLNAWTRAAVTCPALFVAWLIARTVLPNGLPAGVVLLGVVLGSLSALTALGLVLIYRASRVVNFAQAELGALAATTAVLLTTGSGLPLWAGMSLGLLAAVVTGALVHELIVRRLFTAPRLILTVATIGVAQVVASGEIFLPTMYRKLRPATTFHLDLPIHFKLGPIVFTGDHVAVLIVVPLLLAGGALFLTRSDTGIAIRAAAESSDRALLLGIPVRRLSLLAWVAAAGLSGIASLLTAPVLGPQLGIPGGPVLLLAPIAAAVVARMESLPIAFIAAVGIGIVQQGVFWNYPQSSTVDVALFVLILAALLLQRRRQTRQDEGALGEHVALREVRPVAAAVAALSEVRWAKRTGFTVLSAVVLGLPLLLSEPHRGLYAYTAIYCIIAVSLVVVTGWSGQISLGHFAFVGLGAATTASLLVHSHADLFLALLLSAGVGAGTAVLVGVPALRIRGLFLAVTTLAFGAPVSTFLLNSAHFPWFTPSSLDRPVLLGRFPLDNNLTFDYLCVLIAVVAVVLAHNVRQGRTGRIVVAVRDNERAASAFGIEPIRAKLTAFAFSGALAGIAGGLYVVALRGVPFSGFDPVQSLVVFTMVVIGGAASLPGAIMGAVYVQGVQYFLTGAAQLLATGAGLLLLLLFFPGGLGQLVFSLRDRWLASAARRNHLPTGAEFDDVDASTASVPVPSTGLLVVEGIEAAYGRSQVLFGADLSVQQGGVLALLGTNGAGKSSVLKVVCGLLPASAGRIIFDGKDITRLDPVQRLKAGIVLVPGGRGVFASLTAQENLRVAGWLSRHDQAHLERATSRVLQLFPALQERLQVVAGEMSGGQQQMLAIGQALLCKPRLLLIDELSLGLAPTVVAEILAVIRQINEEGTTVVLVEQSIDLATSIAEEAVFLEKGQTRFSGQTSELLKRDDIVRAVFLTHQAKPQALPRVRSPAGSATLLEVASISKSFGGITALEGVNLRLDDGAIVGLIGSNGAGKTTLFDICSGFLVPDAGTVTLHGRDVTRRSTAERATAGLGRTFQDARLFPSMTVKEVLATALDRHLEVREPMAYAFRLGAAVRSEANVSYTADEVIGLMGLGRYRDSFVSDLSTGTRRIVELGCAIAHAPSVLLLDEPAAGIAQREVEALQEVLLQVRQDTGAALAIIEHDIPMVSAISDTLVCMHLGRVIAEGTPQNVLANPAVIASYLGTDQTTIARSGGTKTRPRSAARLAVVS